MGSSLPDAPEDSQIPQMPQGDELQTFVGSKQQNLALGRHQ
jgi:hypothetical protein